MPFTPAERELFTQDAIACKVISNMLCRGSVTRAECEFRFAGWIVCCQRPMALSWSVKGTPPAGILMYGAGGTIFPTYAHAVDAVMLTYAFARDNGYEWFGPIRTMADEWRIFSVVKAGGHPSYLFPNCTHCGRPVDYQKDGVLQERCYECSKERT